MHSFHLGKNNSAADALPVWGDTRLLQAFVTTARMGSISAAARALDVAPSTISKALRALEQASGHTLFWRTTRRLSLSAAGERLLPHCEQALQHLSEAARALGDEAATLSGRLHVAASAGLARHLMRGPLTRWLANHPDLRLQWSVGPRFIRPGEAGVDVVLRVIDTPPDEWVATPLWRSRLVTVASPDYLSAHPAPNEPADLARHRCLLTCGNDGAPLEWRFRDRSLIPAAALSADDEHMLLAAAESGLGIVQAVDFNAQSGLASGRLREVLIDHQAAGPTVFALRLPGPVPAKLAAFIEAVGTLASGDAAGG